MTAASHHAAPAMPGHAPAAARQPGLPPVLDEQDLPAMRVPGPVHSLLVFRALMLGDMICATPALRALRAAWPDAAITLVGLPSLQEWARRQPQVDHFVAFPGWPGLPELPTPPRWVARQFVHGLRTQRYDLALQLHGSGATVNPLVVAFGARLNAGFVNRQAWRPPVDRMRFCHWPEHGREAQRLLALPQHLGLPAQSEQLSFALTAADHAAARALLVAHGVAAQGRAAPYAVLHAGSQLPSRRWPPERFAAVATALAERGVHVLLTGVAAEEPITAALHTAVPEALHKRVHNVSGATSLWTLGALIDGAAVLVCNDTGVSHIAAALGTRSVVVACGSDVSRWAPADAQRHRVFWHDMPCRPCAERTCTAADGCALGVPVAPVVAAALAAATAPASTPTAAAAPGRALPIHPERWS